MAGNADIEGPIHRSILRYLRSTLPHGFVVQHTANKPRSAQQGAREKAMGAISGWPDLAIYGQLDGSAKAWFLEVKPPRVTVPEHQREVHARLMDIGFPVRPLHRRRQARCLGLGPAFPRRLPEEGHAVMTAETRPFDPSKAKRDAIAKEWATGTMDSTAIGLKLVLAEGTVCRVLAEQQDDRRFARKMGRSA